MPPIKLYSYYRSSCSYRVRIGLYLKNLEFSYQAVHLIKSGGEQFKTEFQKINPFAQVPGLQVGKNFLSQSLPILLYLESLQSEPPLLPKDSFQKAKILSFCEMINSGIQPLQNLSVLNYLESQTSLNKNQWAQYWVERGLSQVMHFLKPHAQSFCFGDQVSLADVFLIPQIHSAHRFKAQVPPLLAKIDKLCLQLPAFQKAHPDNQPDSPKSS